MIKCAGNHADVHGSAHELIDEFVTISLTLVVALDKAKKDPTLDTWEALHKLLRLAQKERYDVEFYDCSALGKIGGCGDDR